MSIDFDYFLSEARKYREQAAPKTEAQKEAEFHERVLRFGEERREYSWFYSKPSNEGNE